MVDFIPNALRNYLGGARPILSNRATDARFVNEITGSSFASEEAALADIHATLNALGAKHGDKLSDLQNLYAAL